MDLFANNAWAVNDPAPEEVKAEQPVEQEENDDYEEDDFENQNAEELSQVQNYQKVLEENKEQKKIISVQKAKIQALQAELEDTLKQLNIHEMELDDQANKDGKITDEAKRYQSRIDNQDKQLNKLKQQNQEVSQKYTDLQNTLKDQNKEIDQVERQNRRAGQDSSNKDAKLNRAMEELEKMKMRLTEAKVTEQGKNEGQRRDMERLVDDNRKLERQRNELLQAFKKQMKLIDILKR